MDALARVLGYLTDLRDSEDYRQLEPLLTELPSVDERYGQLNHASARPGFEKILRSFRKFLDGPVGHLR